MADHDLAGFARGPFTHEAVTHEVLRLGSGPAVIVMAEMPGITPKVLEFAERVAGIGCTAVLPVLFGTPGRDPNPGVRSTLVAVAYGVSTILRACVSREFVVWATGTTSPVVTWLRALAAHEHERCSGPGVGAVGMCFTGGYALAMAVDDCLVAPVLSQPSLPFGVRRHSDARSTSRMTTSEPSGTGARTTASRWSVSASRAIRSSPRNASPSCGSSSVTRSSPSSSTAGTRTPPRSCRPTRC
jgi:hypothetical protein